MKDVALLKEEMKKKSNCFREDLRSKLAALTLDRLDAGNASTTGIKQ